MQTKRLPRVLAIHDLCVFGRCSLSAVISVLSARGAQCCPLPAALFSAPANYEGGTALSLAGELPRVVSHLRGMGTRFDAVYTGFLAGEAQAGFAEEVLDAFPDALAVVDPVLGDRGKLYRAVDETMAAAMVRLAGKARIITPNVTEAAILLGLPPGSAPRDEADAVKWLNALAADGSRAAVLTGLSFDRDGQIAVGWAGGDGAGLFCHPRAGGDYPGTGDLFASYMLAELLYGAPLPAAAEAAAGFVAGCAAVTAARGAEVKEGLLFEEVLRNKPNR